LSRDLKKYELLFEHNRTSMLGIRNYYFSRTIPIPTYSNFMDDIKKVLAQVLGKVLLLQIRFRRVLLLLSILLSVLFAAK
jgi:hypothetical protein